MSDQSFKKYDRYIREVISHRMNNDEVKKYLKTKLSRKITISYDIQIYHVLLVSIMFFLSFFYPNISRPNMDLSALSLLNHFLRTILGSLTPQNQTQHPRSCPRMNQIRAGAIAARGRFTVFFFPDNLCVTGSFLHFRPCTRTWCKRMPASDFVA